MVDNFVTMVIQPLALHAEVINVVAPWNFVWVRGSAHHHVVDIAGAAHQIVALFKRAQGSVVYDDRIQFFQQRCCVWGVFCETRFQTNAALALLTWHHVVATISAHHASASSCHVLVVVVFVLGLEFIFTSVFKFGGCSKKSVCGKHTTVVLVFFPFSSHVGIDFVARVHRKFRGGYCLRHTVGSRRKESVRVSLPGQCGQFDVPRPRQPVRRLPSHAECLPCRKSRQKLPSRRFARIDSCVLGS